ncbi:MAG: toll/interleukin-1 receptor domain-containing protein, partial [Rhodoblastus sp.]|nr:toll/interleukin-1 receptor domain-containing protein [Rhodoblastus sp.]
MSRIFVSHSSHDNAATVALRDWLVAEGWSDLFLDLDPERGIAPGERWERALNEAARRCEAVIFVISRAWLSSRWCLNELTLARRLNKRMFGVLIEEGLPIADLPADVVNHWQMVDLAAGSDHRQFRAVLPISGGEAHVTFSREGLARLKAGLLRAGLHAAYFAWPPVNDPKRAPYRGLRPLEADDAGIFFGREAPVIDAIDGLRGLAEAASPRLMAILGASGAGKSSFLRAGLLPRLGRDARIFLPLPAIRPERSVISGETGLVNAIFAAFEANGVVIARGEVRDAVTDGAHEVKALLRRLRAAANVATADGGPRPPTVVIAVDQAEELFLSEAQDEARPFLRLLAALLASDDPAVVVLLTIRSDNYERLQSAPELDGLHQETLSLPPMPKGAYADVVKG